MKKLLITIAIILVVLFLITIIYLTFFYNNGPYTQKVNAKIVNVIEEKKISGLKFPSTMYNYYLEVEYQINGENIRTKCQGTQTLYSKNKIGDEIEILYNPDNIHECLLVK